MACSPADACQEYADNRHPTFEGVSKIVITVDLKPNSASTAEEQAKLPAPLKKDALESFLVEAYTNRFEKVPHGTKSHPPICYGRGDQPIIVLDSEDREDREKLRAFADDPGVLLVILSHRVYQIERGEEHTRFAESYSNFAFYQMRFQVNMYREYLRNISFSLPHDLEEAKMDHFVKQAIERRIYL